MYPMIRFALVVFLSLAVLPSWACFNPTDHFAAEVVLNKSGVVYDWALLATAKNVAAVEGTLIYRSHFEPDVAVIVAEEEDLIIDPEHAFLGGLSVRLQIPTREVDGPNGPDLASAVGIDQDQFDFAAAMRMELDWLGDQGVISGLSEQDLEAIVASTRVRLSGWNSRLVHSNGEWVPYFESDGPLLLRDGLDCGGFRLENLPQEEIVLPGTPTSVDRSGKLAAIWGWMKR